jgi:hypothetical protein
MDHAADVMSMMVVMTTGLLMDEFAVDMAEFVSAQWNWISPGCPGLAANGDWIRTMVSAHDR